MNRVWLRLIASGVGCAITVIGILPVQAGAEELTELSVEQVSSALPAEVQQKFARLSNQEKKRTAEALSDPRFGTPGSETYITKKYPGAKIETDSSETPTAVALASGTRNSWLSQRWTFLGITYATVRTDAQYDTSGSRAYSINYCQGSYTNLIPGRQISYWPSYTNNSDGTITCRTNWTLIRFGIQEDTGVQGFRVNGYGTFIRTWYL